MKTNIVIGLQWGDEGKGKIVDYLAQNHDCIVRACGGANAGHSLKVGDKKMVTHLLPSGVFHEKKNLVIGAGTVVDMECLISEIEEAKSIGMSDTTNIYVSKYAHIVFPWHKLVDKFREMNAGKTKVGTTQKGIGPCYETKAARIGVQLSAFMGGSDSTTLEKKVHKNYLWGLEVLASIGAHKFLDREFGDYLEEEKTKFSKISEYVRDHVQSYYTGNVLIEGAQGDLLDLDYGTYPYVTSSFTGAAGACQGAGVGPRDIVDVYGITKAYCTRVGEGPFPTQMEPELDETVRKAGSEFGATTGRPRKCGWIDLVSLKESCKRNSVNKLIITKLDILSGLKEIKACTNYKGDKPEYTTFEGWDKDISDVKNLRDLPVKALEFVYFIEKFVGVQLAMVSVGPERNQII